VDHDDETQEPSNERGGGEAVQGEATDPSGAVPRHGQEEAAQLDVHRRTRRRVLTGCAVAAIVVVASVVVIGSGGPGSGDASAQVELGARTTLAEQTTALTINGSFTSNGLTIPISGSGFVDLPSHLSSITQNISANGTAVQETLLTDGAANYLMMELNGQNEVSQLLPGKTWVQVPAGKSVSAGISSGSTSIIGELQALTQKGNVVSPLGPSTINGEAVTGYQVTITQDAIASAVKRLEAQGGAEAQALRQLGKDLSIKPVVLKLWLGPDHLLRREESSVSMSLLGTTIAGGETIDFSNYGGPVAVEIPAASDVASYSDFLAAANGVG
jgi:hypothetical protein